MAKGNATRIDTRDARLRVPSGSIALRPGGSTGEASRAGGSYASVTGGVRSTRPSGGGGARSYAGRATNPLARR
jgi:hypothetical protein